MFLSAFLITSTLQAIIFQQVQQIGILKTLGSRRYQVALLYMALIFIFGALAALIAVPLANRVAFRSVAPLTETVNMVFRGARPVPGVIILQVVIALIVPQLAALAPILQGAHLTVQEALSGIRQGEGSRRSDSHGQKKPGHSERQPNPGFGMRHSRLRLGRPTLISIRNTFRRKGRLILTLITLSLGGAIFIATFNVQVSIQGYVDQISQYFLADVNITTTYPQRISKVQDILAGVKGIQRVEGWGAARSELINPDGSVGSNVVLFAPPAGSMLVRPVMLEGRWLQMGDQDAIALNERFQSDFPNLHVGDSLRLRVNGKETDWTIVGFYQLAGRSAGYLAYVNYEYLSTLISQPGRTTSFRVVASQPGLSSHQQEQLSRIIEARLREADIRVADISTGSFLSSRSAQGFSALTGFLLFLASLTALVGSIGLAGTMSMNVMERTREIGILRAIGATNPILMRMVIIEGMLIGLISWAIGLLLAFPMSKLLIDSISMALFGNLMAVAWTPTGFLIWLGAVVVLSVLASIVPARSAARLTIREVLAYE
jgi:putative ABC transport system permease protein